MSAPPRFANLDKLRGFAALSVVLYHVIEHTHWSTYPSSGIFFWGHIGWMGVDLFFVISGLVITYSAWSLFQTQGLNWKSHYWRRRLTRIVPLYLLTLAMYMTLVTPQWLSVSIKTLAWHGTTHILFIHNLFPETHGSIDGVNWSIGVEMQFYLLVALILPWLIRTSAFVLIATFFIVAWAWRAAVFGLLGAQDSFLLFQYTTQLPGTLDQFVLGILLCKIMLDPKYVRVAEWIKLHSAKVIIASLITIVLMFSIYLNYDDYWPYFWMVVFFRTMIGAAACALILVATQWKWKAPRFISNPMDFLGKISYGLYLWHLPVILSLKQSGVNAGLPFLFKTLFATIILATLSYYLFEKSWMQSARSDQPSQLHNAIDSIRVVFARITQKWRVL